jgi:hypothetical protein
MDLTDKQWAVLERSFDRAAVRMGAGAPSALGESRIAGLRDLCCARFSRYAVPLPFLVSFECGG